MIWKLISFYFVPLEGSLAGWLIEFTPPVSILRRVFSQTVWLGFCTIYHFIRTVAHFIPIHLDMSAIFNDIAEENFGSFYVYSIGKITDSAYSNGPVNQLSANALVIVSMESLWMHVFKKHVQMACELQYFKKLLTKNLPRISKLFYIVCI